MQILQFYSFLFFFLFQNPNPKPQKIQSIAPFAKARVHRPLPSIARRKSRFRSFQSMPAACHSLPCSHFLAAEKAGNGQLLIARSRPALACS